MAVLTFDDFGPATSGNKKKEPLTFDDLTPEAPAADEPGFLQQMFDIKNASTGESYLYGNTPAPAPYEDLQRTVGDTVSRGYLDKLQGPEAQAATLAARERMPGWVETPTDIAAAAVASPYRIGSTAAGAGFGALEGAASAYGHQKDWVPDIEGTMDIAKGAGFGAVTGGVGAKVGEKVGEWWGGRQAAKNQTYKTDADLEAAAAQSIDPDLQARVDRLADVRATQGSTRDEFANMLSGMQGATPEETAKIAQIAKGKGFWDKAGNNPATRAASLHRGSRGALDWMASIGTDAALSTLIPIPGAVTGTRLAATGARALGNTNWAKRVPQGQLEELAAIVRDPSGRGISSDPETVNRLRDLFAKLGSGYGRSQ